MCRKIKKKNKITERNSEKMCAEQKKTPSSKLRFGIKRVQKNSGNKISGFAERVLRKARNKPDLGKKSRKRKEIKKRNLLPRFDKKAERAGNGRRR